MTENAHARKCLISTSSLKSDVTIVFLDFLYEAGIPAIREHLRQKFAYLLGYNSTGSERIWMKFIRELRIYCLRLEWT